MPTLQVFSLLPDSGKLAGSGFYGEAGGDNELRC
jgi:hypothetical protein